MIAPHPFVLDPQVTPQSPGRCTPGLGVTRHGLAAIALALSLAAGCGESLKSRTLDPVQVGISESMMPTYDDGELLYYEVKRPIQFPIYPPSAQVAEQLAQNNIAPFGREPWFDPDDVAVQVTWTVSNLDPDTHAVRLLLEPWNEFGRYWPGLGLVDAEEAAFLPNRSGIELFFEVPGTDAEASSRLDGTMTFDDMEELAIDFATVINVIENPPVPLDPTTEVGDNLTVQLVNHAFHIQNRSYKDPLVKPYGTKMIPGLTGIDVGLRMEEPGNVALEVVVEIVNRARDLVIDEGVQAEPIPLPQRYFTVASRP